MNQTRTYKLSIVKMVAQNIYSLVSENKWYKIQTDFIFNWPIIIKQFNSKFLQMIFGKWECVAKTFLLESVLICIIYILFILNEIIPNAIENRIAQKNSFILLKLYEIAESHIII